MIAAFSVRASYYVVAAISLCLKTPERYGASATVVVDTLEEGLASVHPQLPPAIEAGTRTGPPGGGKRHLGAAEGDLLLLQACYQDDDCAPGLFTVRQEHSLRAPVLAVHNYLPPTALSHGGVFGSTVCLHRGHGILLGLSEGSTHTNNASDRAFRTQLSST